MRCAGAKAQEAPGQERARGGAGGNVRDSALFVSVRLRGRGGAAGGGQTDSLTAFPASWQK